MKRFLVTGAAGFIGSHLAGALGARGDDVIGLDSFTGSYDASLKRDNAADIMVVEADLTEAPLDAILLEVDGVFHLGAEPGARGGWGSAFDAYVERNIVASERLFHAAGRLGVPVVFASSSSVYGAAATFPTPEEYYGRPLSPYGVTKLACEQLGRAAAHAFGLELVILRFFTVFGPRQRPDMAVARIMEGLQSGEAFERNGDGSQSRDMTYVDDAVGAALVAMDHGPPGSTYNVGGGTEVDLDSVIRRCEQLAGRRLTVHARPPSAGDAPRTSADTSRIRAELGWVARTSLEEGLAAQWAWQTARSIRVSRPQATEVA